MLNISTHSNVTIGILVSDETERNTIIDVLSSITKHTFVAASTLELLIACEKQQVQLVVLSQDQLEACQAIRANPSYSLIPILACIYGDEAIVEQFLQADVTDCYRLPLFPSLFKKRITAMLQSVQSMTTLAVSDQRMRAIISAMQDTVFVINRDGTYTDIPSIGNPYIPLPLHKYLGRKLEELLDKKLADYLMKNVHEVLDLGESRHIEYEVFIENEFCWHNSVITRLNPDEVVIVMRDVTESRQKEQSLRESDRLYRNLFESATDSIFMVELDTGKILEANESAARMLGYTPDELAQQTIYNIEVEVQSDSLLTDTFNFSSREQPLFEQNYRRKDGSLLPVESHSRIIHYRNKAAILYFSRDITHRKRALQTQYDMRLFAEALRDSAAAFNKAITVREVLDTIISHVTKIVPVACANVMTIEGTVSKMTRWKGYDQFNITDKTVSSIVIPLQSSSSFQFMQKTKQPILINDTRIPTWRNDLVETSPIVKAYMGAPIIIKDTLYGFLNLDGTEINFFKDNQLQHLQAFANQAAIAIQNAQLFEQIQQDKIILEEHIAERTEALVKANASLRQYVINLRQTEESLERERSLLKMIIDSIADMIYMKDKEGKYLLLNQAAALAMGGQSDKDIIGQTLFTRFDKDYAQLHAKIDETILATGKPVINMRNTMIYADGSLHHQLLSKQALYDNRTHEVIGIVGINRDITQLEVVEQNLREEREKLAQVLMSARCLLWSATVELKNEQLQWNMHIINEAAAQALLPLDTTAGPYSEMWQKSIFREDAERRQYVLRTHLQFNRHNFRHELRCKSQDGEILWLAEEIEIHEIDSSHWRLVGVCTDITERKQAENNLQKAYDELELRIQVRTSELVSVNNFLREQVQERQRAEDAERKQRLLAETLNQSVATLNSTFDRDEMLDYLLDTIDGMIPHQAANILLLEDNNQYANVVRHRGYKTTLLNLRHKVYENWQFIMKNKTFFIIPDTRNFSDWANLPEYDWIRSSLSVAIMTDDGVIGFLNLDSEFPNNFTPEHAELLMAFANQAALAIRNASLIEQIRNYATELEQTVSSRTAQLRAIFGSMREGLIFHNMEDRPQYVNPATIEMFGYTSEEWLNNLPHYEDLIVIENIDKYLKRWSKLMETQGYLNEELVLQRKDKTTFDASIMRVLVTDDTNHHIGTLTLIRDISQAKQLQEQRERFIANASHELRTPIANIKTRLYLLKRKPENFVENLDIAMNATNWMQRLVDDMFDLARFQRGTIELKREIVTINQIIQDIITFQQPEAERKDINLVLDTPIPAQPIEVFIDPYRVMQVLSNLISNAINYTPDGGEVRIQVFEREETAQKILVMAVSDNGPGIAPNHMDNLFKPFYRASNDSRGAGLGLSISQEIVTLHGGNIHVKSEIGVGTQFIVEIPLATANTPEAMTL